MSDFAPGLPSKSEYGDTSKLKPGDMVDFVVQRHHADRAGPHYDVRIGTPETGLFSWATRKELPKPGSRIAFFRQPLHSHDYKDFEGEIPEGYGKGSVKKHDEGKVLITKISDRAIHFTKAHKKFPERFVLIKPVKGNDKQWLLLNTTPTKPIPYKKIRYATVHPDEAIKVLEGLTPGSSVQAKIDGAASLTKILDDKLEIASYRTSKESGHPIIHTERVTGGQVTISVPKKYIGSVLRGELYGTRGKDVIPPQELGGLLNSSVMKSLSDQKERKVDLKNMIFDVQMVGNKPTTDLPYEKRLEIARDILGYLPEKHFHGPEEAKTSKDAIKLFKSVKSGKHPLTREGVVIHRPSDKPIKVKFTEDRDVHITGFFPGEGRLKGSVGGFTYSLKAGGPTVGKVGTGFSDDLRREMAKDPNFYIGRIAKVKSQEKLPSGALRAPALIAIHEDYPTYKVDRAKEKASSIINDVLLRCITK